MPAVVIPAITGGVVERYEGDRITCAVKTGVTVRGGRLVELTGAATGHEVQEAGAVSLSVLGVALYDADPAGEIKKVTVATEGVYDLLAVGAINAGDQVFAGAAGTVTTVTAVDPTNVGTLGTGMTATRAAIGTALDDIVDATVGPILLRIS
jgi:hypothetical protein